MIDPDTLKVFIFLPNSGYKIYLGNPVYKTLVNTFGIDISPYFHYCNKKENVQELLTQFVFCLCALCYLFYVVTFFLAGSVIDQIE